MTKEELEKQTMEWKNHYILKLEKRCANYEMQISKMEKDTCDICKEREKDKRLAELEKENAELKQQIEKMKCCSNCSGKLLGGRRSEKCRHCKGFSEWELAND